jgi:hypothetical protein
MTAKTVKLDQGRTSSALFSCPCWPGFLGLRVHDKKDRSKNVRIKRYYQKVQ